MAASTNNLSQGADDAVYKALQELAKAAKPDGTFYGEIYAAGILKHDKVPSACLPADFLWFKVKGVRSSSIETKHDANIHIRSTQLEN